MGFEVLAGLKQQLAEQAKRQVPKKSQAPTPPKQRDQATQDPALVAISRLQRHYPEAFPRKPAPKRPLKIGVFDELKATTAHGLDEQALRLALAAWCQGRRYWDCLKAGEARVDLAGTAVGEVSQAEAQRAKQLNRQQRDRASRNAQPVQSAGDQSGDAVATTLPSTNANHDTQLSINNVTNGPDAPALTSISVDVAQGSRMP